MAKTKLSIIVPCYNEEKNIQSLITGFDKVICRSDIEVVLVNNGSTDNSAQVIEQHLKQHHFLSIVNVKHNKGYGFGIMSGLRAARGHFLGWTHADLQTDPGDVIRALDIIEERDNYESVYVKGDRKRRPLADQFFTMGMSLFETLYLKTVLWDINAQPNIFHRTFFEKWQSTAPDDFSLDLFVLYQAKKMHLDTVRFPVLFPERQHGESHWNTSMAAKWKFIRRTIDFSTQLKKSL